MAFRTVCPDCMGKKTQHFKNTVNIDEECRKIKEYIKDEKEVHVKIAFTNDIAKTLDIRIGQYLYSPKKVEPNSGEMVEHMWVLCGNVSLKKKKILGLLVNKPAQITSIKRYDVVYIDFDDIEEISYE